VTQFAYDINTVRQCNSNKQGCVDMTNKVSCF